MMLTALMNLQITRVTSGSKADHARVRSILEQIKLCKAAQREISMMDEFAKHAKIERKVNRLKEELEGIGKAINEAESNAYRAFQVTFYAILVRSNKNT